MHHRPAIALQVGGPLLTLVAVVACDVLTRRGVELPVPMVCLLLTVVLSAVIGGVRPAITSAVLVLLYSLHYFSIPGSPLSYHATNLRELAAVFLAAPVAALAVGSLRQREIDRRSGDERPAAEPSSVETPLPTFRRGRSAP